MLVTSFADEKLFTLGNRIGFIPHVRSTSRALQPEPLVCAVLKGISQSSISSLKQGINFARLV